MKKKDDAEAQPSTESVTHADSQARGGTDGSNKSPALADNNIEERSLSSTARGDTTGGSLAESHPTTKATALGLTGKNSTDNGNEARAKNESKEQPDEVTKSNQTCDEQQSNRTMEGCTPIEVEQIEEVEPEMGGLCCGLLSCRYDEGGDLVIDINDLMFDEMKM